MKDGKPQGTGRLDSLKIAPTLGCDLVMKGGITSGVVYPQGIIELAKKYRLKCIGGTSAGAIAAGIAAAAEHGRSEGGYETLGKVAEELPLILPTLFQPTPQLRPVFDSLNLIMTKGDGWIRRLLITLIEGYPRESFLGGLMGAALGAVFGGIVFLFSGFLGSIIIPVVLGGLVGTTTSLLLRISRAFTVDLPAQDFGMCPGLRQPGYTQPVLTEWISDKLNEAARLKPEHGPLTFGDLYGPESEEERRERERDPSKERKKNITLEVMTTSLGEGRPYRLPFVTSKFFFNVAEFRKLFPKDVVEHLIACGAPSETPGFHQLPAADDLPVVVAVRMSLSFPFLLCAIPLYAVDYTVRDREARKKLYRCVFSDGGLSSNLPIHFFDSPLPGRPTFAMNLEEHDPARHGEERVGLPTKPREGILRAVLQVSSLGQFVSALSNSMQNWQDNLRINQPGTRERVATIRLRPGQGGLNLNMSPEDTRELIELGRRAGERLTREFDFEAHRWRRYLTWFGAAERCFDNILSKYESGPNYREFLENYVPGEYVGGVGFREDTNRRVEEMMALQASFSDPDGGLELRGFSHPSSPSPKPSPILSLAPDH